MANDKYESYYDGIPEDIRAMSPEELEKAIEEEKEKSSKLKSWRTKRVRK